MNAGVYSLKARSSCHAFVAALVCVSLLSSSGCLHYLGRSHSSLSPRTAQLDRLESTLRAQDALSNPSPSVQADGINQPFDGAALIYGSSPAESTASAPANARARLLMPQFKGHSHHSSSSTRTDRQSHGRGHSLPVTADHLRAFMNRQSENPMSTGTVLPDQRDTWQVRVSPEQPVADVATPLMTQDVDKGRDQTAESTEMGAALSVNTATFKEGASPVTEASSTASNDEAERSVFDRLKGLYDVPRDVASPSVWKRQIQKLQSPWSVFRDRNEPELQNPLGPTQTVEAAESLLPSEASSNLSSQQTPVELLPLLLEAIRAELETWPRTPSGAITDETGYRRRQQDLRLLYLIADQPGEAIASMEMLSAGEQEFWQELMLALAQYRSTEENLSEQERLTNTVGQLMSSVRHLTPHTALVIQRSEICSRINSFGRVETFPSNDFDPGQPILLYVELQNFGIERTPDGTYRTAMDAELAIFQDGNPEAIETVRLPDVSDESTSERRDYFQSFELNLPSHLATGAYYIRLRLRDRVTTGLAESRIEFQVR